MKIKFNQLKKMISEELKKSKTESKKVKESKLSLKASLPKFVREEESSWSGLEKGAKVTYTDKKGQKRTIDADSAASYPEDHPAYQAYMTQFADEKSKTASGGKSEPEPEKPAKSLKASDFKSSAEV